MTDTRRLIPAERLTKFKQLFKGLEIDRVLGERVLVHEVEAYDARDKARDTAGIVAPEGYWDPNSGRYVNTQKADSCAGLVMQVGPAISPDLGVSEGSMLLFSEYAGNRYNIGGVKVRVLDISEVICTLRAVDDKMLTEVVAPVTDEAT